MITEFMWLKHGKPLPDGWRFCDGQALTHHHHYGVLIMREISE